MSSIILAALFFLIYPYIWAIIKEWGYIKTLDILHASIFALVIIFLLPLADMVYISYLSEDFDCNGPGCVMRFTLLVYFYSDIIRWGASTGIFRIGTPDNLFYLPPILALANNFDFSFWLYSFYTTRDGKERVGFYTRSLYQFF